jgi:GGDEF domain-containing protein
VTASIGIATTTATDHLANADELIKQADLSKRARATVVKSVNKMPYIYFLKIKIS